MAIFIDLWSRIKGVVSNLRPVREHPGSAVPPTQTPNLRYKAFLSYRRADDEEIAATLQRELQRFARPWYRAIGFRVFRDKTAVGVGGVLSDVLRKALDESEFLILMASPGSAQAPWVVEEVRYWCELGRVDRLLIVRTAGSIIWDAQTDDFRWDGLTSVPRVLSGLIKREPSYLDLSWARARDVDANTRRALWRDAVATLSAALLRKPKEEVIGEEIHQRKRLRTVTASVIVILSLLTATSVWLAYRAEIRRRVATSRQIALQALRAPRVDQGLLLGAAALAISDTTEARGALLARLQESRRLRLVIPHQKEIMRVARLGEELFAAADEDGRIFIHRTSDGTVVGELPGQGAAVFDMVAHSGARLVVVLADGRLLLWDVATRSVEISSDATWPRKARVVSLAEDGSAAAVGGTDGAVYSVELASRRVRARWEVTTRGIISIALLNPDTGVVGTDAGDVLVISMRTGATLSKNKIGSANIELVGSVGPKVFALDATGQLVEWEGSAMRSAQLDRDVIAATYSRERDTIAVSDSQGAIRLYARESGGLLEPPFIGHALFAGNLAFLSGGRILVSSSFDQSVMLWDLEQIHPVIAGHFSFDSRPMARFGDDGSLHATVASADAIRTWLLQDVERRLVRSWEVAGNPTFAISRDTTRLAWTTGSETWIRSLDWGMPRRLASGDPPVLKLTFSRDGRFIAATDRGNRISVWDAEGKPLWTTPPGPEYVTTVSFSPDGCYLAAGTDRGALRLYDRATGTPVVEHAAVHNGLLFSLAFDETSTLIVSGGGGGDRNIVLRQMPSGRVQTLRGVHRGPIGALAFNADGDTLASAANDGTVVLWDRLTLQPLGIGLTAHQSFPNHVGFRRDGNMLVSSDDESVFLWKTDVKEWLKIACRIAGRELTQAEWDEKIADDDYRPLCDH